MEREGIYSNRTSFSLPSNCVFFLIIDFFLILNYFLYFVLKNIFFDIFSNKNFFNKIYFSY
jgi:restriction endonuclease S subunit